MGNNPSTDPATAFYEPIQALFKNRGLKLSHRTISRLLRDIEDSAPWFGVSGSLTVPSWEKLGKDLDRRHDEGTLSQGTLPLWRMIYTCLKEGKCEDIIQQGRRALSICQDSPSENESLETTKDRPKKKKKKKEKSKQETKSGLYPILDVFKGREV